MSDPHLCFCGTKLTFAQCCQPFILAEKKPTTAEQLMRSRFSAYATKSYQYIVDTYSPQQQKSLTVKEIADSSSGCHWLALVVYPLSNFPRSSTSETEQFVEFSAFYLLNDSLYEMRENSRFLQVENTTNGKNNRQWFYVNGDIIKHEELSKISRNQPCPCNNYPTAWAKLKNKKYKQCCGK